MITAWNVSYKILPADLAESIAGYNKITESIWLVGGSNGSVTFSTLWKLNTTTNVFEEQHYQNKEAHTAESYTSNDQYIYFTTNYTLLEFPMTSQPKFLQRSVMPSSHYADRPSITTDQKYLFLTGGIESDQIVSKLSIHILTGSGNGNWIANEQIPRMNIARMGHNCIARNNYLFIFGGYINDALNETTNTIEKLYIGDIDHIEDQKWVLLNDTLNVSRAFMRIAEVHGLIYVIGGYSAETNSSVNTVDILDPITDEVTSGVPLDHETNRPAVIVDAANSQIYIFGGYESWDSSDAMNMTQKSNKMMKEQAKDAFAWFEVIVSGVAAVVILCLMIVCYRGYKRYKQLGGREHAEGRFYELSRRSFSYGAAEGMHHEGRPPADNAGRRAERSVLDTASFES